ncbi:GNAT family N-acetyltransferase [Micromonospora citrea]|uniref:GNAT family N-acetyltransferase n=1 Tax=Micromonospora citrea TaxID=47855 RepID=UPI003C3CE206
MTGPTVRPATPADFAAVARLTVAAYEADGQLKGEHGYAEVLADVSARAVAGEVLVAVDRASGAVLGSVTFVLSGTPYAELSGPGEAEFRMLAVDPAAQGLGTGAALVRACVDRAGALGCTAVVICVRDGFAVAAHRLYRRMGFVRTPEKDWSPVPGVQLLGLRLALPAQP